MHLPQYDGVEKLICLNLGLVWRWMRMRMRMCGEVDMFESRSCVEVEVDENVLLGNF